MSISRLLLRLITVRALSARTLAEDRVKDSSITDLEAALTNAPKSIILVYTDDSEFVPDGRELFTGGVEHLVLLISNAGFITFKNEAGGNEQMFAFPVTDPTLEFSLDMMERQITVALMDMDNPWAALWHKLVTKVSKFSSKRGQSDKEGTRFAARQIIMQLETLDDPIPGAPLEGVWKEITDAMKASEDPDFAEFGNRIELLIEGKPMPEWKRTMTTMGMPFDTFKKIGLAPLVVGPNGEALPEEITEITPIDEDQIP